jgi:hypothetical protein
MLDSNVKQTPSSEEGKRASSEFAFTDNKPQQETRDNAKATRALLLILS